MVRGLCPRDCIRWAVGARRAHRGWRGCCWSRQTTAPNPPRQSGSRGASRTPPLTVGVIRTLQHVWSGCGSRRLPMVRGLCPRNCIRWVVDARRAHRGKRGCHWSRRPSAPTLPRRSRNRGAPRTVHPTCSSETGLAAYIATGAENHTSRLRKNVPYRTPRRGRRPRRPLSWMTDDVIAMRKCSPHIVGRTVPGAPPSDDRRRWFHAPPHLRARPCVG